MVEVTKIKSVVDYYDYDPKERNVGTPRTPYAVNFFVLGEEKIHSGQTFRVSSLVPRIFQKHSGSFTKSVSHSIKAFRDLRKTTDLSKGSRSFNRFTNFFGMVLPGVNFIKHWVIDGKKHDHSSAILGKLLADQSKEVIGVAIEGKIVKLVSATSMDSYVGQKLTNAERLWYLKNEVKENLKRVVKEHTDAGKKLPPLADAINSFVSGLTPQFFLKRDIETIRAAVARTTPNIEFLDDEDCQKLIEIATALGNTLITAAAATTPTPAAVPNN